MALATQLRMENIRNRISPHYMFNVLNTVMPTFKQYSELAHPLQLLIQVLRGNLLASEKMAVELQEEIELVKNYIALRKETNPNTIHIEWEITEQVPLQTLIPSMSIQIPVENALKYAFEDNDEQTNTLSIHISKEDRNLSISIRDNGSGYDPGKHSNSKRSTGNGLKVLFRTIELLNSKNTEKIIFDIRNIGIIQYQPDLLFLDVEMPYINGIELLQEIRPYVRNNMRVIFYSAFDKYMLDALRASAFDYLLKPYQTNELKQIVERIKREKTNNPINFDQAMRQLLSNDCKFAVQTISRLLLLRRSEILYFQYSEDTRCWQMTLTNMEQYRLRLSTKAKDILNFCPSFIRVNTDCILNIDYLSSVENNTLRCILYAPFSHLEISASRRHYSKIKEALNFL